MVQEMVKSLCPMASLLAIGVAQTSVHKTCPHNFALVRPVKGNEFLHSIMNVDDR